MNATTANNDEREIGNKELIKALHQVADSVTSLREDNNQRFTGLEDGLDSLRQQREQDSLKLEALSQQQKQDSLKLESLRQQQKLDKQELKNDIARLDNKMDGKFTKVQGEFNRVYERLGEMAGIKQQLATLRIISLSILGTLVITFLLYIWQNQNTLEQFNERTLQSDKQFRELMLQSDKQFREQMLQLQQAQHDATEQYRLLLLSYMKKNNS